MAIDAAANFTYNATTGTLNSNNFTATSTVSTGTLIASSNITCVGLTNTGGYTGTNTTYLSGLLNSSGIVNSGGFTGGSMYLSSSINAGSLIVSSSIGNSGNINCVGITSTGVNTGFSTGSNWGSFKIPLTNLSGLITTATPYINAATLTNSGGNNTTSSGANFTVTNAGAWRISIDYNIYGFEFNGANGITILILELYNNTGTSVVTNSFINYRQSSNIGQVMCSNNFIATLAAATNYTLRITPTFSGATTGVNHLVSITIVKLF